MRNPDPTTTTAGRTGPPWTAPETLNFRGGFLSNFAPTPGRTRLTALVPTR
jgi:hypothetical protein